MVIEQPFARLAIIPARGGSKRLPRKNIMPFGGRPMIAWTIEAALTSGCFDHVLVSTEDPEIAKVAVGFGAEVPFLRDGHHDDVTPVSAVTLAALEAARSRMGWRPRTVVQLMANCPLRTAEDVVAAVHAFDHSGRQLQLSCFRFGWQNPWWALELDSFGHGKPLFDTQNVRSQDLPPLYCPTGAIWIANVDALTRAGSFYGAERHYEPLPWTSAVDIDDADDLTFAQALLHMRGSKSSATG